MRLVVEYSRSVIFWPKLTNAAVTWSPCDSLASCFNCVNACVNIFNCALTRYYAHFVYIHRLWKKRCHLFFVITLPNPNRSTKFFYRHTQQ